MPTPEEEAMMVHLLHAQNPGNDIIKIGDDVLALQPQPGKEICDFCSYPGLAAKVYFAEPFELKSGLPYDMGYDEQWGACKPCADLIDAGKIEEVTQRAFEHQKKLVPQFAWPRLRNDIKRVHMGFWEQRKK